MKLYKLNKVKCLCCDDVISVNFSGKIKRVDECSCENVRIRLVCCFAKQYSKIFAKDETTVKAFDINKDKWLFMKDTAIDSKEVLKNEVLIDIDTGKRVYEL